MADEFRELGVMYGGAPGIPDGALYSYITREDVFNSLADYRQLGLAKLLELPLVQEVRRRCEQDLYWLGRYFLWSTTAFGAGKPLEESMVCEHVHRRVSDLFIKKDKTKKVGEQDWRKDRLILYPRYTMKALDIETLVPTPTGFVRMADIEPGETVIDELGNPCTVTNVSPIRYSQKCYEVTFSTGERIVADAGHLWVTDDKRSRAASRNGKLKQKAVSRPSSKTTENISQTLFWGREHNHRVSVCKRAQLPTANLPIPPYSFGCWLGDGHSDGGRLTNIDEQIIEEIRLEGEPIRKASSKYGWGFNGGVGHPTYRKNSSFSGRLRALGVIKNKHIPNNYLFSSESQRTALLQGLMDTDGTCCKSTGMCSFSNSNRNLLIQVRQLVASLGLKPGKVCVIDCYIKEKYVGKSYSFCFTAYAGFPVFKLQRKKVLQQSEKSFSKQNFRHIVSVLEVESRPVKCLSVNSPSHQYLAGESFIPTHNSTFDGYDVVQWVLNFPDIRILYLTAEQTLAEGFVAETKTHFVSRPDEPSLMNLYFPEFCFEEKDSGPADMLLCPVFARKQVKRREPTVWGSSVESTLSGKHFEIIKADDSVSDENSNNDVQCKKIADKFNLKRKMLLPTGYVDKIGTRYAEEDMYGEDLRKNVANADNIKKQGFPATFASSNAIVSEGNWEIIDNEETGLRVLIGRSITIKPSVAEQLEKEGRPVTYAEAGESGCNLLFPEHHSYKWCMKSYSENERIFEGQQNQNPRTITNTIFDRPLMLKHTIPFNDPIVPQTGPISQFWDFAFSTAKGRDYTTGSCAIWNDKNQCTFIDLIRAKYKPFDLAKAVVNFAVKYKPFVIGIEAAAGAELLRPAILQEAYKTNIPEIVDVCSRIDWVKPSNQKDAKATRMRALHPWIAGDMMYFVSHLPYLDVLYDEFERCLTSHHHDDIPDNFSYQPLYAPRAVQAIQEKQSEMFSRADGSWQLVFDSSGELYGEAENHFNSPFKGYVLINDPNTGEFRLVGENIPNPIVVAEPVQESKAESAYEGLDNILGAGLIG